MLLYSKDEEKGQLYEKSPALENAGLFYDMYRIYFA